MVTLNADSFPALMAFTRGTLSIDTTDRSSLSRNCPMKAPVRSRWAAALSRSAGDRRHCEGILASVLARFAAALACHDGVRILIKYM